MAEMLSSNGTMSPRLQSGQTGGEALPDVSTLVTNVSGIVTAAIGPVLAPPDPLSRGAVVQVDPVAGSNADPLGGNTSRYLQTLIQEAPGGLLTKAGRLVDTPEFQRQAAQDPHQYRFMLALPDAHRVDLHGYTRDVMARVERDLERPLDWLAVAHTQHRVPHVHVILRGRDLDGQVVQLTQQYQQQGLRYRAQEAATEALGTLPVLTQRGREAAASLASATASRLERALEGPREQMRAWAMTAQVMVHRATRAVPSLTAGQALRREEGRLSLLQTFTRQHAAELRQATTRQGSRPVEGPAWPSHQAVLSRLTPQTQQLLQSHTQRGPERSVPPRSVERNGGLGR